MDLSNRAIVPMTTVMSEDKNIILGKSKNLSKNTAYSFTVMVSNMYGSVSTDIKTLCEFPFMFRRLSHDFILHSSTQQIQQMYKE